MIIVLILSCLISGFLGYGLTMGFFTGEFGRPADHLGISLFIGAMCAIPIFGLFGLFGVFCMSNLGRHGLRWNHNQ